MGQFELFLQQLLPRILENQGRLLSVFENIHIPSNWQCN